MKSEITKKLAFQLTLIFLVIILVMILGLGLPATIFMRRQAEQQLRALLDQTHQTTDILFENKSEEFQNLGLLVSERPTLVRLLIEGNRQNELSNYLERILQNSQADMIVVCSFDALYANVGMEIYPEICETSISSEFVTLDNQYWWISNVTIESIDEQEFRLIIGQKMNAMLRQFNQQTKLDYFFYDNDILVAFNDEPVNEIQQRIDLSQIQEYDQFSVEDVNGVEQSFMAAVIPVFGGTEYQLIGLLDISPYKVLDRQLRIYELFILIIVTLAGVISAVLFSKQVSKPMSQLANSAINLQEGDFSTQVITTSKIWEIKQLANALDDARIALRHSLNQLQVDKNWIEALLDSIIEGIITIDGKSRITFVSAGVARILNTDPNILLGKSIDQILLTPPGEELFSHQVPPINQNARIPVILNNLEALLSVSVTEFIPPEAGNATRALVFRDVTAEEKIHKLMGDFIASITHEFRTPLTALSASVELLLDQLHDLSVEEIRDLLHALNVGIINLQTLIDNLIEASSIEGGRFKVSPKPIEFQSILDEAITIITPIIHTHRLNLVQPQSKESFLVMADKRRTIQVLINILSNAIKHSPSDGNIIISTVILENEVLVEISDEGEGVNGNLQARLFNRFIVSKENNPSQTGLGLGLSVVKAIIDAQNGHVGFTNREDGGAIFWFTLPIVNVKEK